MAQLNKEALEANVSLTEDEKTLIAWVISIASDYPGASSGEIVAYRFLMSLTPNGNLSPVEFEEKMMLQVETAA